MIKASLLIILICMAVACTGYVGESEAYQKYGDSQLSGLALGALGTYDQYQINITVVDKTERVVESNTRYYVATSDNEVFEMGWGIYRQLEIGNQYTVIFQDRMRTGNPRWSIVDIVR